jgi:exopolyphosphatase/guanosine-5'-triphosphate,3'-diphosphate pyrophosphatase
MARLAAVDLGSNTVHALVAESADGRLEDLASYVEIPEIGPQVARTARIGPEKAEQAISALRSVVERARRHDPQALVVGATAAIRAAADAEEFLAAAGEAIATPIRLISDRREAELSFAGVASRHASERDWLMADIGGGSTELVAARGSVLNAWASLPLGSGVLSDRFLSDPPLPGEREELRAATVKVLTGAPESAADKLVATGGTASNLPRMLSQLSPPTVLDSRALLEVERRLDADTARSVAGQVDMPEPRVRALRGGVEILLALLDFYGLDRLQVTHAGLRQGMLLAYLDRPDSWWVSLSGVS